MIVSPSLTFTLRALALGGLTALALTGCSSSAPPPAPVSTEEAILHAESKAQEHRVFYEGWMHPSEN